ncbi:hypothetical protein MSL71_22500 [Desulfoluna butyratoxydans]|uniref:DUF7661 domain-containing protein n=2 Tax=Desulfoluna butyratoxydans TaxID=231438 RepID=A0A4U8YLL8_9BACT|nr:hypothetical protein MSL71_22500 [Desulfoluna butyratoxydans]
MDEKITFNVFGRTVLALRKENTWALFYLGTDGKRRPATDLVVPSDIKSPELEQYLSDLCHEWATEKHPDVFRVT